MKSKTVTHLVPKFNNIHPSGNIEHIPKWYINLPHDEVTKYYDEIDQQLRINLSKQFNFTSNDDFWITLQKLHNINDDIGSEVKINLAKAY